MNQISWLSLGKALRGGVAGWVSFGRGGEEAGAGLGPGTAGGTGQP